MEKMTAHMIHTPSRARQSCANCDAFMVSIAHGPGGNGKARVGYCAANPPILTQGMAPVPGSQLSPSGPQMMPVLQGAWPPTEENKWCRCWQWREDDHDAD